MKKNMYESMAGFFVFAGLVVLIYMTVKLGDVSLFRDDTMMLTARFSTVTGLRTGNPIEMFGIKVGTVADLAIDDKAQMATATLHIDKDVNVYDDAIASIKTAGLIGDKFISLDPGGSGEKLKNNDVIINTESPVDLGDLIGKYAFGSVEKSDDETTFADDLNLEGDL